jgi:hypothetical protein
MPRLRASSDHCNSIQSAMVWLNGFGIRVRPGWRLYNVSGLDAVELRLKTGDIRRIGTDDPRGLAAALKRLGAA